MSVANPSSVSVIPEKFTDLLAREARAISYLGLVRKDGSPHVTPMWFDYVDGKFVLNTARGRLKDRILRRHPVVTITVADPDNLYRYLQVTGPVVEETEEGAFEEICDLNEKYHGNRNYPRRAGEVRVTYRVRPERANGWG